MFTHSLLFSILFFSLWVGAHAQVPLDLPPPENSLAGYGRDLWDSTVDLATAPAHWEQSQWLELGGASLGVIGTAGVVDRPLRNYVEQHPRAGLGRFAAHFEHFGAEYSFGVLGIFYADGLVTHNRRAQLIGEDGLTASILADGLTLILKEAAGRSRPSAHRGVFHFAPFSGNASFPSGHTVQAFAVASVIAARFNDTPWIDTAAYGTATLVGISRIFHDAHFASDVVAGALIGNAIGRRVVSRHDARHRADLTFVPLASPKFSGAGFSWQY